VALAADNAIAIDRGLGNLPNRRAKTSIEVWRSCLKLWLIVGKRGYFSQIRHWHGPCYRERGTSALFRMAWETKRDEEDRGHHQAF
jgi:hypothetical protein